MVQPQQDLLATAFLESKTAKKEKDRSLRSDKLKLSAGSERAPTGRVASDEELQARNKAFTAVAVLIVAIGLLMCLYKFSTITEGKSK